MELLSLLLSRVLVRMHPGYRQKLRDKILDDIRRITNSTINGSVAGRNEMTIDQIRDTVICVAIKCMGGSLWTAGISETELTDFVDKICSARSTAAM